MTTTTVSHQNVFAILFEPQAGVFALPPRRFLPKLACAQRHYYYSSYRSRTFSKMNSEHWLALFETHLGDPFEWLLKDVTEARRHVQSIAAFPVFMMDGSHWIEKNIAPSLNAHALVQELRS